MKKLYLLRHADSNKFNTSNDKARIISSKGLSEVRLLSKLLKTKQFKCDLVLCSSSTRTMQTWEALSKYNNYKFPCKSLDSLYSMHNPGLDTIINLVSNTDSKIESVLIIGHNPTLSEFATFLNCDESVITFSTCTMKSFILDINNWKDIHKGCGLLEW